MDIITLKRLVLSVLGTGGHETGHLILFNLVSFMFSDGYFIFVSGEVRGCKYLSELDLLTAEGREGQVSDLELSCWCSAHDCDVNCFGGGILDERKMRCLGE